MSPYGLATTACIAVISALIGAGGAAGALEQAGVSAAVRGQVQLASDTQPIGVQVVSGQPIYLADRISSGAQSGMQIMLLDQTTFTIGPDSFVKIDEFVYDPTTNAGKVTASLGKGVFRFVSGKIAQQNPSNMTVNLPVATIGIRGTMVYGRSDENSAIIGLAGAGPDNNTGDKPAGIDVVTPAGRAEIRRPGWGVNVVRGQAPVVEKLPKPTVDAILAGVAPRDLINAVAIESTVANATLASRPATVTGASKTSGQSAASGQPNMATFQNGQNQQQGFQRNGQLSITGNGSDNVSSVGSLDLTENDTPTVPSNPFGATTFNDLLTLSTGRGTFTASNIPIFLSPPGNPNAQTGTQIGSYIFTGVIDFGRKTYTLSWAINTTATIISHGTISITQNYSGLSGPIGDNFTGFIACGANATCDAIATFSNSGGIAAKSVQQAARATNTSTNDTGFGGSTVTRP
jgi:hypothetical protein